MIGLATMLLAASSMNWDPMTDRIEAWVNKGYYKGAALLVVKDDKTIYKRYFGSYTPNTVAYIASSGKWLAAATIASVVDEGKLSWDDRVDKWLPEMKDNKGKATLRQLLSHTSGYPDYQPAGAHTDDYQTLTESVSHIVDLPPMFAPGERFCYGGLAMQVAGRMAELATGKDWETLFQERIATPLGMVTTYFVPVDPSGGHSPMLGGGARCNLEDYGHFLDMISHEGLYHGHRILSRKAIQEMQADQVQNAKITSEAYVMRARGQLHTGVYGLGEWRERIDRQGSATLISSPSWAGAYPWIDKTRHLYGFFLTHVEPAAFKAGFNSFYGSPTLADSVARVVDNSAHGVKTGRIDVGGARLVYEEKGHGEPVILLHAHSVDRRMWDDQFEALAKRFRVIRYDKRGYGESDMPQEGVEFTHAEDLHQFMQALGIPKAHLVGLSLGSIVAADFLATHPNEVMSIAAAAGGIREQKELEGESSEHRDARHAREILEKQEGVKKVNAQGLQAYKKWWIDIMGKMSGQPEVAQARLWRMVDDWEVWQPTHIEAHVLLDRPVAQIIRSLKPQVPGLFIIGAHDSDGSKTGSAEFAALLPGSKTVILKNAGHFSNLEEPAEWNRLLVEFLESQKR